MASYIYHLKITKKIKRYNDWTKITPNYFFSFSTELLHRFGTPLILSTTTVNRPPHNIVHVPQVRSIPVECIPGLRDTGWRAAPRAAAADPDPDADLAALRNVLHQVLHTVKPVHHLGGTKNRPEREWRWVIEFRSWRSSLLSGCVIPVLWSYAQVLRSIDRGTENLMIKNDRCMWCVRKYDWCDRNRRKRIN